MGWLTSTDRCSVTDEEFSARSCDVVFFTSEGTGYPKSRWRRSGNPTAPVVGYTVGVVAHSPGSRYSGHPGEISPLVLYAESVIDQSPGSRYSAHPGRAAQPAGFHTRERVALRAGCSHLYNPFRVEAEWGGEFLAAGDGVFTGDEALQLTPQIMPSAIVVKDAASAAQAIDVIVTQGEGTPQSPAEAVGSHEFAHYYRFAEIAHSRKLIPNPAPGPHPPEKQYVYGGDVIPLDPTGVYAVPTDPKASDYPAGSPAALANDACNSTYTQILKALHLVFNGHLDQFTAATNQMDTLADQMSAMMSGSSTRACLLGQLLTGAHKIRSCFQYGPIDGFNNPSYPQSGRGNDPRPALLKTWQKGRSREPSGTSKRQRFGFFAQTTSRRHFKVPSGRRDLLPAPPLLQEHSRLLYFVTYERLCVAYRVPGGRAMLFVFPRRE